MRFSSTLFLALIPGTLALGQTSSTGSAPSAPPAAAAPSAAPDTMPTVTGTPQNLYALRYIDTQVGTGPLAESMKFYTVRYTGWLAKEGTKFDSSYDHPGAEPITFPYGAHQVIPGWDTGFQGMHIGGKRRLFIPWQLAYGESGRPPVIPPKADLVFDVELVSVSDAPPEPSAPPTPPQPETAPDSAAPATTPQPPGHSNIR